MTSPLPTSGRTITAGDVERLRSMLRLQEERGDAPIATMLAASAQVPALLDALVMAAHEVSAWHNIHIAKHDPPEPPCGCDHCALAALRLSTEPAETRVGEER